MVTGVLQAECPIATFTGQVCNTTDNLHSMLYAEAPFCRRHQGQMLERIITDDAPPDAQSPVELGCECHKPAQLSYVKNEAALSQL